MLAAQGDTESLHKLYFAVAPLMYKITSRFFPFCHNRGIEPEDLLQCRYFALLRAVKDYSPEKEFRFTSYLNFHVGHVCLRELGFRGKRQIETISLETPVSDDESIVLGDTIEDPDADTYSYCELNEIRLIVRAEIDKLPPKEQLFIYGVFYKGKTLPQVAHEMGWSYRLARNVKFAAYHQLRRSEGMQELRRAYQWDGLHNFSEFLNPESMILHFGNSGLELI